MEQRITSVEQFLSQSSGQYRWVQQSPVLPDVWKAFESSAEGRVDVLITPHRGVRPAQAADIIRQRFEAAIKGSMTAAEKDRARVELALTNKIAHNQSFIAASVTLEELLKHIVPLSRWYQTKILPSLPGYLRSKKGGEKYKHLEKSVTLNDVESDEFESLVIWWLKLLSLASSVPDEESQRQNGSIERCKSLSSTKKEKEVCVFRVAPNRMAFNAGVDAIRTIKADAATRVFDIKTDSICWAVIDSGIDALHPAFKKPGQPSRVRQTYDFTRIRKIIALASTPGDAAEEELENSFNLTKTEARQIGRSLQNGGDINWEAMRPALQIKPTTAALKKYAESLNPHGTHVAGILGGSAVGKVEISGDPDDQTEFSGICPDIQLIDLRVLDKDGMSVDEEGRPEFDIIAALQFVTHLNSVGNDVRVNGVNLSIQLQHDPRNFACGQTPVCEECNRLMATGVVVVAAAGNLGIEKGTTIATTFEGAFRDISISDPGNAESIITVGSTHRKRPFEYGVSYFSGRGPTGDGRQKPDLVAPGEKVLGPVLDGRYEAMQGTSQAAPCVSGAAAILLARHAELIGDPKRVKEILCASATDLGRQREFQGFGLVDILRALQSV